MPFLGRIFGSISNDIGIDLGTANTLVYVRGRGIVINEPSVVAINQKTGQILSIGEDAKRMVGKTPAHIVASRPLVDGVISDFEVTEQMLRYFIRKAHKEKFSFIARPKIVIGVPSGVTEVEKRAVNDAATNAGAREVFLIEEPMAAAIGSRLPVQSALGNMIVDIGGGTTEIAVVSLGGIVLSKSLKIAGDKINQDIVKFARANYNLLLGNRTAENIKIMVGSAFDLDETLQTPMRGRDIITGLPKEVIINDEEIRGCLNHSVQTIVNAVKAAVEETPPELVADIMDRGIILAGGGSLLRGLSFLISQETQMPVRVTEDPLTTVARGCGIVLEDIDILRDVLVDVDFNKPPKGP